MKTIEQGLDWLMNHKPDLGFFAIIITCAVWITTTVWNFNARLNSLEVQLPALKEHVDKKFEEVDAQFEKVDQRFDRLDAELVDIKLMLKKIDTYLATTNPNYKPESK